MLKFQYSMTNAFINVVPHRFANPGLPIMMQIPVERGFLYSSAVLAVGLVALVAMLAMTALLWGMGLQPVFTY